MTLVLEMAQTTLEARDVRVTRRRKRDKGWGKVRVTHVGRTV